MRSVTSVYSQETDGYRISCSTTEEVLASASTQWYDDAQRRSLHLPQHHGLFLGVSSYGVDPSSYRDGAGHDTLDHITIQDDAVRVLSLKPHVSYLPPGSAVSGTTTPRMSALSHALQPSFLPKPKQDKQEKHHSDDDQCWPTHHRRMPAALTIPSMSTEGSLTPKSSKSVPYPDVVGSLFDPGTPQSLTSAVGTPFQSSTEPESPRSLSDSCTGTSPKHGSMRRSNSWSRGSIRSKKSRKRVPVSSSSIHNGVVPPDMVPPLPPLPTSLLTPRQRARLELKQDLKDVSADSPSEENEEELLPLPRREPPTLAFTPASQSTQRSLVEPPMVEAPPTDLSVQTASPEQSSDEDDHKWDAPVPVPVPTIRPTQFGSVTVLQQRGEYPREQASATAVDIPQLASLEKTTTMDLGGPPSFNSDAFVRQRPPMLHLAKKENAIQQVEKDDGPHVRFPSTLAPPVREVPPSAALDHMESQVSSPHRSVGGPRP